MDFPKVFALGTFSRACADCQLQDLCLPIGIPRQELDRLEQIVERGNVLHRGTVIYRQYDAFGSLFAVRSGSVKSIAVSETGTEQVVAFYLPGDILGFDGISEERYPSSAVVMETSTVCELPFDRLHALAGQIEGLQHQLLRILSRELGSEDRFTRLVAHRSAEVKVAGFLVNLAARHAVRGYSGTEFMLSMTRAEIGSYLGVAEETVSRALTRFHQDRLIAVQGKAVKLLQRETLANMAGHVGRVGLMAKGQGNVAS